MISKALAEIIAVFFMIDKTKMRPQVNLITIFRVGDVIKGMA
ncbi:hypothetical protein GPAL_3865 [Glaciecola pallidula DSM 14239 = ACAM 615]|uniref:Uncharacterized protein n=1 Tax=Brumicola pallidula DSM 14239 = ACAM 615 TaxID=1121922 RepID=K7A5F2_9ALTE|nr:hypothetical protein GPAL_3865 [Glaciecola pallidula DSM 14239 = ACAM 615]